MTHDPSRRGFLQGLLATIGGATLVRTVRPAEVPALVGVSAPEAMEYAPEPPGLVPGSATLASVIYASVKVDPLELDKNFGFRYLSKGIHPHSVRLQYDSKGVSHDVAMLTPMVDNDETMMVVCGQGAGWVEVVAYRRPFDKESFEQVAVDFGIMVMRMVTVTSSVEPPPGGYSD